MFYGPFRVFRPRNPLARLVTGVLGIVAVLLLVALGMFAIAALAIGGGLFLLINAFRSTQRPATQAGSPPSPPPPGVIEGEFTVVPATASRRDRESAR